MAVRQGALTVVAAIRPEVQSGLEARLDAIERGVQKALTGVTTLHFARFVILDGPNTPRLAFESNHDGDRREHIAELAQALAPFEDDLFGAWVGYERGQLAAFVDAHALPASTFYLSHPGLAVSHIKNDDLLRRKLDALLDEFRSKCDLSRSDARTLRKLLLDEIAKTNLSTGPLDRGLPRQPLARLQFYAEALLVGVLLLVLLPVVLLVERHERETEPERELVPEDDELLARVNEREDKIGQNGLTHHVPLRPGRVRRITLRIVLWFLEQARKKVAYTGTLGDIQSIHFARWVLLDDDTVLFFSNYDGSWESYLGDFVDKAAKYLTAVWSNTKWFPDSWALVLGGAANESQFKRWARTFQVENRIWYSAYPHLSVSDVLRNALIREGTVGEMTEEQARAWLAQL